MKVNHEMMLVYPSQYIFAMEKYPYVQAKKKTVFAMWTSFYSSTLHTLELTTYTLHKDKKVDNLCVYFNGGWIDIYVANGKTRE